MMVEWKNNFDEGSFFAESEVPRRDSLPEGAYYAILGDVAKNYRGMTNAVFQRSSDIAASGRPVQILTLGFGRDYGRLEKELKANGTLHSNVEFLNIYEFLSGYNDFGPARCNASWFNPLDLSSEDVVVEEFENGSGYATKQAAHGAIVEQRDFFRPDGSISLSDVISKSDDPDFKRKVYLCDHNGTPRILFSSLKELRYFWLDKSLTGERNFLFSDSFRLSNFVGDYQRHNVEVIQTIHNNVYDGKYLGSKPVINQDFYQIVRRWWKFDARVFLTNSQLTDFEQRFGSSRSNFVVPNARRIPSGLPATERDSSLGLVLARLDANKRVDHAIEAVRILRDEFSSDVKLKIFGDGPTRDKLDDLIHENSSSDRIALEGYSSEASLNFSRASFSLLTSQSEAMGLVIVESMFAGCIPIAYDIDFGPADIISHGKNGFLVEPGNPSALADAINTFMNLDDDAKAEMREAAIQRAHEFAPQAVLSEWGHVLRQVDSQRQFNLRSPKVVATKAYFNETDLVVELDLESQRWLDGAECRILAVGRSTSSIAGSLVKLKTSVGGEVSGTAVIDIRYTSGLSDDVLDLYFSYQGRTSRGESRISCDESFISIDSVSLGIKLHSYKTTAGNLSINYSSI